MLEILYHVTSKVVRSWNGDEGAQGNLKPKGGERVAIIPGGPPSFRSDDFRIDLVNKQITGTPIEEPPDYKDLLERATSDAERLDILSRAMRLKE